MISILSLLLSAHLAYAATTTPQIINPQQQVITIALAHNIDPQTLRAIVEGESQYRAHPPDGDMDITCKRTNSPIRAKGAVQITSCFHPEITDDEAYNFNWSVNWAAEQIAKGKCKQEFSTCPL